MTTPLIALCVGHSRRIAGRIEGGAISAGKVSEHTFNSAVANRVKAQLATLGIDAFVVDHYEGNGYAAAQKWLAAQLKQKGATLALELHFNASEGQARGAEWLYWGTSANGKRLAECVRSEYIAKMPNIPDRGIEPKDSADRGAEFLRGTHCPAIICEPFFGDNVIDWAIASTSQNIIANAYAQGIAAFLTA